MRFTLERRGIYVEPENNQDVAYIEDTLGLVYANSFVRLRRIDKDTLAPVHFMLETLRLITTPEPMMPLVYVCHPYSADPPTNRAKVAEIARRLVGLHLCPVAPQLFMRDLFPDEVTCQDHIMALCKRLMLACSSVYVFGRSKGCDEEIAFAAANHMIMVRYNCQHCGANTFFQSHQSLAPGRSVVCEACAEKLGPAARVCVPRKHSKASRKG